MNTSLDQDAINSALAELPGWQGNSSTLTKTFPLPTYKDGLVLANAIGFIADQVDHHPDMLIGYRKVTVTLSTHDAGGVTGKDVELARRIANLVG